MSTLDHLVESGWRRGAMQTVVPPVHARGGPPDTRRRSRNAQTDRDFVGCEANPGRTKRCQNRSAEADRVWCIGPGRSAGLGEAAAVGRTGAEAEAKQCGMLALLAYRGFVSRYLNPRGEPYSLGFSYGFENLLSAGKRGDASHMCAAQPGSQTSPAVGRSVHGRLAGRQQDFDGERRGRAARPPVVGLTGHFTSEMTGTEEGGLESERRW